MCDNPQPAQSKANHQAETEQRITRARAALVMEHPFFGSLALRLRLKADPACADMWTDGKTLAYNPIFAATLSAQSLVGATQMHRVRKTIRPSRQPSRRRI